MLLAFKAPVPDPFSGEVSLNRSSYSRCTVTNSILVDQVLKEARSVGEVSYWDWVNKVAAVIALIFFTPNNRI